MDDTDRPLSLALAELARTMPDDPRRLSRVRERARRARRRRTLAQGTVVTATVGGLALGLVASGPGSGGAGSTATGLPSASDATPDTTAEAPPSADPATLPTCTEIAEAQAAKQAAVASAEQAAADAAKAAHAAADGVTPAESADPDPVDGGPSLEDKKAADAAAGKEPFDPSRLGESGPFRANALVSGPSDGPTLTLAVKDVTLSVVVDDATRFVVDGADGPRPALADGAEVAFQATRSEAGDLHLDQLEVLPPKPAIDPAADPSAPTGGGVIEAVSATPPVEGTTVVVAVDDGPLGSRGVTLTVGAATQWLAGKEPCRPTELAIGTKMGFTATTAADGSYVLDVVDLPGGG
jgi:hypothetical protein